MRWLLYCIGFCLISGWHILSAQLIPSFGEERTGTSIATALKVLTTARAVGLNGATVALADDASLISTNPAGLFQTAPIEAAFSAAQWIGGARLFAATALYHLHTDHAIALTLGRLGFDPVEVTTEVQPYGTGEWFLLEQLQIGVTYAHRFTDRFTAGVTLKGLYEKLGLVQLYGYLLDIGTLYYTGLANTRIGIGIANFGIPMKPQGTVPLYPHDSSDALRSFAPPTTFRFGAATEILQDSLQRLTATLQFDHPADQAEQYALGLEYARKLSIAMPFQLQLRAGYRINAPLTPWTAGVSVQTPLFLNNTDVRLDYSIQPTKHFGILHRLSLLIQVKPEQE